MRIRNRMWRPGTYHPVSIVLSASNITVSAISSGVTSRLSFSISSINWANRMPSAALTHSSWSLLLCPLPSSSFLGTVKYLRRSLTHGKSWATHFLTLRRQERQGDSCKYRRNAGNSQFRNSGINPSILNRQFIQYYTIKYFSLQIGGLERPTKRRPAKPSNSDLSFEAGQNSGYR